MRKTFLFVSLCISVSSFAQFHLASFNKSVSNALSKIIEDFPNNFSNIRGEVIGKNLESVNYTCTVNLGGIDSSVIIQNGDSKDNIFSWKQTVFASEDFDAAKTKFREYYNKIKGTTANVDGNKINFQSGYIAPSDEKNFTTIIFTGNPQTDELKNLVIDLSLQYIYTGWEITVSVYEHIDYGVNDN